MLVSAQELVSPERLFDFLSFVISGGHRGLVSMLGRVSPQRSLLPPEICKFMVLLLVIRAAATHSCKVKALLSVSFFMPGVLSFAPSAKILLVTESLSAQLNLSSVDVEIVESRSAAIS